MTTLEAWMLGCTILMTLAAIGALIVSLVALRRKQEVRVQQPLEIAMTEQFTSRHDFDILEAQVNMNRHAMEEHVKERSEVLFHEIKETREKLERRINRISVGVARLCGKMNVQMPSEDAEL